MNSIFLISVMLLNLGLIEIRLVSASHFFKL